MNNDKFANIFEALTDNSPFPWQVALFKYFINGQIPETANIPTGLGKTSIVAIWLIALAEDPSKTSRRLVYVVNRRTVVDQTTEEVRKLCEALKKPELTETRQTLLSLCALPLPAPDSAPLAVSTLRGQFADNREWSADPSRPAVIVGTVDMIGSGLLFNRYTCGFKTRPLHAGFLAQDALLVHDEAHLEPSFQKLLESLSATQAVSADSRKLHVLELTATSRSSDVSKPPFSLSYEDKKSAIEDGVEKNVVVLRYQARKKLRLLDVAKETEVPGEILRLALEKKDSSRAVLIFHRSVEAANKMTSELIQKLGKRSADSVVTLTGNMRGKERDDLLKSNAAFQRFLPSSSRSNEVHAIEGTAFLVATSAGEVGVNLSADDLISDLSTYDSMAQRFGRVNRFGHCEDTSIIVVHGNDVQEKYDTGIAKAQSAQKDAAKKVKTYESKNRITIARLKTLKLLRQLAALDDGSGNASPAALDALPAVNRADAFSPPPEVRVATNIQFDAWALTSIRKPIAARPPVAPYLHGEVEWEPAQTQVAWRHEVQILSDGTIPENYIPEELLEDFPLKPHELLRDTTERIVDRLTKIAESHQMNCRDIPDAWLLRQNGEVEIFPLSTILSDDKPEPDSTNNEEMEESDGESEDEEKLSAKAEKDTAKRRKQRCIARLSECILILPPSFGGLSAQGFLSDNTSSTSAAKALDVSDAVLTDSAGNRTRLRLWNDARIIPDEHVATYRLIRAIDTKLDEEDMSDSEIELNEEEVLAEISTGRQRYWLWLESRKSIGAERHFSVGTKKPETLDTHTARVEANARAIAAKLLPVQPTHTDDEHDLRRCLILAARLHDLGKNRSQWQRNLGNLDYDPAKPETILAKSTPGMRPRNLAEHYRHEFGSLIDATSFDEFATLNQTERDIVLHLIATHHGRARPDFPENDIFDYQASPSVTETPTALATGIPRRFARLQHRFGRWGLAWLESLLRAADYAASAGIVADAETTESISSRNTLQTVPHKEITPTATIAVDPVNPGHYFACCGLFELASRLVSGSNHTEPALAWFAQDRASRQWRFHLANTPSLCEILNAITTAEIMTASEGEEHDTEDSEDDESESEEKEASAPPLFLGEPFNLRLDWWITADKNTSALKVWAGSMKVLSIANSMKHAIEQSVEASPAIENVLFDIRLTYDPLKVERNRNAFQKTYEKSLINAEEKRTEALKQARTKKSGVKLEKEELKITENHENAILKAKLKFNENLEHVTKNAKKEPFYFDANRGPNAHSRDVGFATNDLKLETLASPAVEFLTLVGLQRAIPAPIPKGPRKFDYHLWVKPLPISLLPAAVNGLLPDNSSGTLRFESWYRTGQRKHKAFLTAQIISNSGFQQSH